MESPAKLVCAGVIIGAHGIKGEVKVRVFLEDESLLELAPLLGAGGDALFSVKVTGVLKDCVIVRPSNIADRNAAEKLKGVELFIPASLLAPTTDDEFYHVDLLGLDVFDKAGKKIAKVKSVHNFGAGDILEIEHQGGESEMLPFAEPWVESIDIENGRVVVTPVEYLADD